jgi:hypothetical protein
MAIIGEELQGFVINQINARQLLHGSGAGNDIANTRTDQQLNLLISNTSWIKLASGVSITGAKLAEIKVPSSYEGMGLAKKYILNAGFSQLEDGRLQQREGFLPQQPDSSYTYGTYGYSPMPGIISADIKTLNRGSLKKATVRIKINNKEQFDIIDVLYLRLGFTVLLEWGNSIYTPDGITRETVRGTLVEDNKRFFNSAFGGKHSYLDILPVINFYKTKYAGNYDALLGKVSNFSWSFNADGSYDAEITIISLGDVIESLKLNVSTDKNLNNFIVVSTGGAISSDLSTTPTDSSTPLIAPTSGAVPVLSGNYSTSNDNNPFNLRQNGGDITKQFNGVLGKKADPGNGEFIVFDTIDNGVRAGMKNLSNYFVTKHLRTLNDILTVYCPGYSSSYKTYILIQMKTWDFSVTWTSTLPDFKGNLETNTSTITMFRTLVKAIFTFEGGDSKYLTNINSFPISNL